MKTNHYSSSLEKTIKISLIWVLFCSFSIVRGQIPSNAYTFETNTDSNSHIHLVLLDQDYLVHTVYSKTPAHFKKTVGGFYQIQNDHIILNLEFNSDFPKDSITSMTIPFALRENQLFLEIEGTMHKMEAGSIAPQELDGKWLMAGRVTEEGESRRDTTRPRKTMKFLHKGYFQWIAYNTETMDFSGTGGGFFTSKDGKYSENIQFFSRDNTRVGAKLDFTYDMKDGNWHHMGKSSKGDPLHEIWVPRE